MAIKLSWNKIAFKVSETEASLFGKVKLTAERETEDEGEAPQQYVKSKNGKAAEIELTAILNASLGVDVRDFIMRLMDAAQREGDDYIYMGGGKLFPFKVLLTKAATEEIKFSPSGAWVSANVNLTFKQSTGDKIIPEPPAPPVANSGGSGGNGGSSGGKGAPAPPKKPIDTLTNMVNSGKMTPQKAVEYAKNHGGVKNDGKYYG